MSKNKVKKEGKLKKKINEMKQTSKGKAILKLIGWSVFFVFLFIFLVISSVISNENNTVQTNDNNQEDNVQQEFDELKMIQTLKNNLINSNYDYVFEISFNEEKYVFEGNKNYNINEGYKTSKDGIIKYYIDGESVYEVLNGEKILNDNLLDKNEQNYLKLEHFLNLIDISKLNNIPCNCLYDIYNYKDNLVNCTIYFAKFLHEEDNYITKIYITSENYSYVLSFRNVGSN